MTIRVLLVDDQPLLIVGLRMVIRDTDDIEVVGTAGNGREAVRLARELRPDVVLMDIRMPEMDGVEATRLVAKSPDAPRVVVLTTFDDDEYVYGALRAGASGFLVKNMALEDILGAVRVVAGGEALLAPSVTRRLIEEFTARPRPAAVRPLAGITGREREVLALIGQGSTNGEIAERMAISGATVKTYVTRLLTKLGARDRVHLVIMAYEAGLAETRSNGSLSAPGERPAGPSRRRRL